MRQGRALPTVWGAGLIALGCGGSKSSGSNPLAEDACRQLHQATAQAEAACHGGAAADWQAYRDQTFPCATYAKYVADGSVTFDAAALPGCLQEIQSAPCEQSSSCEYGSVFVGRVADGMPCADYAVCGPQSGCFLNSCTPTCARGGAGLGEPCLTAGCLPPLGCDQGNDVCVAPAPEGGPCGGLSALPCAPGLFCMLVDTGGAGIPSGTCAPYVTGPCSHDYECRSNQFCYQGTCKLRLTVGAACGDAPTGCGGFSACDTANASPTCIHTGLPGEPCAPLEDIPVICMRGSVCGSNYTCVPPGQVGDACQPFTCALPLTCGGTCRECPAPDAGQP